MRYIFSTILLFLIYINLLSQGSYHVAGVVVDERNQPMPGCHVSSNGSNTITDARGHFYLGLSDSKPITITVSFIGYNKFDTTLVTQGNHHLRIAMNPDNVALQEVKIRGKSYKSAANHSREVIDQQQLSRQITGTLVGSLDRNLGFNSMDIGASASKPVIRGMGFNRVVVLNNGIKQEGQQWGADHGLEIDPFLTEQVEIIKGASSLEHGSDALGGILQLNNNSTPDPGISGSVQLLGKSVNETAAGSLLLQGAGSRLFFKMRLTAIDYGDYNIPTDTIVYLTRKMPCYKRRLKNSAGQEQDLYLRLGYNGDFWRTALSTSRVWQKAGFFPGAHGVPDILRVADDGDRRNIAYPYQSVEHWNITSNTTIQTPHSSLSIDLGVQQNNRREYSQFHTHYSNQPPPASDADLELDFLLRTWSGNLRWNYKISSGHTLTFGGQQQWQNNASAGYSFLLPDFDKSARGIFLKHQFDSADLFHFNVGIRYDYNYLDIAGFYDPILFSYLASNGIGADEAGAYATRAQAVKRSFDDFSWITGLRFSPLPDFSLAFNAGKSFRAPTANELATNGVHHGSFRHEAGDKNLSSEKGIYADLAFEYKRGSREITLSPYYYYFSNYIFLNPTGEWSILPHAGQLYRFTQSEAVMLGVEMHYSDKIGNNWEYLINAEWMRNHQKESSNYPLPFSPPANVFGELSYLIQSGEKPGIRVSLNAKFAAQQNRIARNEEVTPAYTVVGADILIPLQLRNISPELIIKAHNLFDTKYYNHISYYRKIEIPEPGRNIQILVNIPF